jgi:broad specificity phosphatase PhoE
VDLSKSGYNQARRWANCPAKISTIGAIYTSPMNRCVETARLIAERIKCPVYNVAELAENLDPADFTSFQNIPPH